MEGLSFVPWASFLKCIYWLATGIWIICRALDPTGPMDVGSATDLSQDPDHRVATSEVSLTYHLVGGSMPLGL